jgi:hypothetical protein
MIIGWSLICTTLTFMVVGSAAGASVTNRANDRIVAASINLKATDLPGWTESPTPSDTADPLLSQLSKCVGASPRGQVVRVSSSTFTKGMQELSSEVAIDLTPADTRKNVAIFQKPKVPHCAKEFVSKLLTKELTKSSHASVKGLTADVFTPSEGVPQAVGLRIAFKIRASKGGRTSTLPVVIQEILIPVGLSEVVLNESDLGTQAPFGLEASLVGALDARGLAVEKL